MEITPDNRLSATGTALIRFFALLVAVLFGTVFSPPAAQALEVPGYRGYVNDYAEMISPATEAKIERALASFDLSDSTQIAVLTVPSLEGDSLEDFSIRTVQKWGIGQKRKDNGVLLLVAKADRKTRIEVGYGLEGVLTDLLAGRIIDQVMTPLFRQGQFDQGFEAGVAAVIDATRGEFTAPANGSRARGRGRSGNPASGYFIFAMFLIAFLGRVSRPLGIVSGALLLPLVGLAGFSSIGLLGLLLLAPVGAMGGFLLPLLLASQAGRGMYLGGGGFGSGGGSSFGGFGGGGFGGGGASGSW